MAFKSLRIGFAILYVFSMAFSIADLSKTFSNAAGAFSRKEGGSVIGVDIGTSTIKIIQLHEKQGTAILETYGEIALGPYGEADVGQAVSPPPEKIAEALKDLMREANVTATEGGVAVPLSASLISLITLPTRDREDLTAMIPIEARKYIPVPVSEVSLDWFVIPDEERAFLSSSGKIASPNSTDVLLVAIHNTALSRFQSVAAAAGIVPHFYEIESFSMARSSFEHGTAPTMIIDCGASSTRVYVIEFGIVDVSHTIPRGGQDITLSFAKSKGLTFTEAETEKRKTGVQATEAGATTIEFIFSEARRIFLAYQRKEGKPISKVVLVGGGAALKGIEEIATRNFDAPVVLGTPFERVSAPAFIADVLSGAGPTFATAVGLALRALKP